MDNAQKETPAAATNGAAKISTNESLDNTAMRDAAQAYAQRGWHVLPLKPNKRPHTVHGLTDASTDPKAIAAWWARWPSANIGISTGPSGLLVLDVDSYDGGDDTLAGYPSLPDTVESITGGGGRHLLFKRPDGSKYKSVNGFAHALDCKADGGYIVAPPSLHESGRRYEWEFLHEPDDVPLADPPGWLVAIVGADESAAAKAAPAAPPAGYADDTMAAFNAAHDPGEIMERHGYRATGNRWMHPESASGTPGVNRLPNSDPLCVYSHHGCDALLGDGKPHDAFDCFRILEHGGDWRAAYRDAESLLGLSQPQPDIEALTARAANSTTEPDYPDNPALLADLPGLLGEIQRFIYGGQVYRDAEVAGLAAMATLTLFTQTNITVNSYGGLGLNEQYMVLAGTGGGKESIRKAIASLYKRVSGAGEDGGNLGGLGLAVPTIHRSAPASKPALHQCLEDDFNTSIFFLADEFGEWLAASATEPHKRDALGYQMELYTSALAKGLAPSRAVTRKQTPVDNPRVSALATSTPERMSEAMSASAADSGAFNRWVILLANDGAPKEYEDLTYEPSPDLVRKLGEITRKELIMRFTPEAWEFFKQHDAAVPEKLKREDHALAGRLSEQAIKMAALLALSDDAKDIGPTHLQQAFAIREGIYYRTAAHMKDTGAFSPESATGQSLEQVVALVERKGVVLKSQLPKLSRKYQTLSVPERHAVLNAAYEQGSIKELKEDPKRVYWAGDGF